MKPTGLYKRNMIEKLKKVASSVPANVRFNAPKEDDSREHQKLAFKNRVTDPSKAF